MKKVKDEKLTLEEILKRYWGYDGFRPMQREIIESVMAHRDTLALLPTGGGKSLTYQVPALALEGVTIVITPLIALMKDQVDRLRALGISAIAVHSGLSMQQIDRAIDNCVFGSVKVLYVAPERFASSSFQTRISSLKVSLIAVDEAHCISQWGYDFRPSYLQIGKVRERFPEASVLALTASATTAVCDNIMENLNFREPHVMKGDFSRPNLVYAVRNSANKEEMILKILQSVSGSAIIYTRTRKGAETICELLKFKGYTATFYHGGLPHAERSIRQDEWLTGEVRVMVATNAFGMGIDKADVRIVIHYMMCDCVEAYYQEAGRAGRDGKRSYAVLLTSDKDSMRIRRSIDNEFPSLELIKSLYDKICVKLQVAYGEGEGRSMAFDVRRFCAEESLFGETFHKAVKILQMNGYMTITDELKLPSQVIFLVSRDELYRVRINNHEVDVIIRIILRLYDGVFTDFRPINEEDIARLSGYSLKKVTEILATLWRLRVIRYIPSNKSTLVNLTRARVPIEDIFITPESYKFRKALYTERFEKMIEYSENRSRCRAQVLIDYFGIECEDRCGICDICLEQRGAAKPEQKVTLKEPLSTSIKSLLKERPYSPTEMAKQLVIDREILTLELDQLLLQEQIKVVDDIISLI